MEALPNAGVFEEVALEPCGRDETSIVMSTIPRGGRGVKKK
jgi:hypothetical protein